MAEVKKPQFVCKLSWVATNLPQKHLTKDGVSIIGICFLINKDPTILSHFEKNFHYSVAKLAIIVAIVMLS